MERSLLWLSVILIGIRAARSHKADGSGQLCGRQPWRESLRGEGFQRGGLGALRVALMCGDRWQREQKTLWHSGLLVFLTLPLNDCLDLIGEDSSGQRSALCIPLTTKPAFINCQIHMQVFILSPLIGRLKIDGRGELFRRVGEALNKEITYF